MAWTRRGKRKELDKLIEERDRLQVEDKNLFAQLTQEQAAMEKTMKERKVFDNPVAQGNQDKRLQELREELKAKGKRHKDLVDAIYEINLKIADLIQELGVAA